MNLVSVVLFCFVTMYTSDSLAAYIAYLLAGRLMPYRRVFTLQIPAAIIQSIVYSFFVVLPNPANELTLFLALSLWRVSEIAILTAWVNYLFRDMGIKKRFFYMFAVFLFVVLGSSSANYLTNAIFSLPGDMNYRYISWIAYTTYIGLFLLIFGIIAAIIRFVSRTDFWSKQQSFADYPNLYLPMGIIYFLLYYAAFFVNVSRFPLINMVLSISCPVVLGFIGVLVSDIKKTENLIASQNLLLQQQSYISKLESIQQEIRIIQHDYKNMLSGLYAHAHEGNVEAVKEYISTKLLNVDETVREDIRQMSQLTRIDIPELKGLIMLKMLEAEHDKISFRLEVMFQVRHVSMRAEDLLRCVGILLDNAIEEAQTQEDAAVTLSLLQEDTTLTVVIKNPVHDKPDLSRIWNEGYSTKGTGRGIGLSNYQNVIKKYPNVTQETKIDDKCFMQILVLPGKP